MAFTEQLKARIRRRSQLKCCLCHEIGIEIHHIVPQAEGGADTEENAAPLCPSCHEKFGDNPKKRKLIREARDVLFEICDSQSANAQINQKLPRLLESIASKEDVQALHAEIRKLAASVDSKLTGIHASGFHEVPIEKYIQYLYEKNYENKYDGYNILFDSRLWYESGDDTYELLDMRKEFLDRYGEETARRLCLKVQSDLNVDLSTFTEETLASVVHGIHVEVCLILWNKKFGKGEPKIICGISEGDFVWQQVD